MALHPLIFACAEATGLDPDRIQQATGLALRKVQEHGGSDLLHNVQQQIPEAVTWLQEAPTPRKSLLGGIAGAVGGKQAQQIAELSHGLTKIGIPVSKQKLLAQALSDAAEKQYPDLKEAFEKAFRT